MKLSKPQKYLKSAGLLIYIVLLNTICPLSTDMYMPSLPVIADQFGVTTSEINSTLYMYYLLFAIGVLLLGPVSDKYGRKPLLVISTLTYTLASLVCFFAQSLALMIIARSLQGIAAGGMIAVITAVIKDSYEGRARGIAISITQALAVLGPIVAPLFGSLVIQFTTWEYVFFILTIIGCVMTIMSILFQETIPANEIVTGNMFHSYEGIPKVLKNKTFMILLLSAGLFFAPFMGYIAEASYIYQVEFGCSAVEFSLYFALASALSVVGAGLNVVISKNLNSKKIKIINSIILGLGVLSAVLVMTIGHAGPAVFFCVFTFYFIFMCLHKTFMTDIILSQHDGNTGSSASLLNFVYNILGSFGMVIGSLPWQTYVGGLGITMLAFIFLSIVAWIFVLVSKNIKIRIIR